MDRETVVRTLDTDRAKLLAYAWSMLRDHHAAEDLYQDLLIVAMGQFESFNDDVHLLKWSRVTLRNKAMEFLRRSRPQTMSLDLDVIDQLESHWNQLDSHHSAEVIDALRRCLESLTPNARQLIELRYVQGLRGTDVAKATDRQPHTIYVALSRAYKALGDCINARMVREQNHA